jgi:hypothetical protein
MSAIRSAELTPETSIPAVVAMTSDFDMLDWMTLDADLRSSYHLDGSHPLGTVVTNDKIYYLKSTTGKTWDIVLYDSSYLYDWITGSYVCTKDPLDPSRCADGSCGVLEPWEDNRAFKKFSYNTNNPIVSRTAQGGFPGTRVVASSGANQVYKDCTYCGWRDEGNIVHEVWGPYDIDMGGDIGLQSILKITYFRGCIDTSDTSTCEWAETNWYSQRYGWVRWTEYQNVGGTFQVSAGPSVFNLLVSGSPTPDFPCF